MAWDIAAGAAGAALGQGLGMIFQGANDRRQVKQQKKLNDVNAETSKDMAMFNQQMQMDLWNKTGYGAQKKQMQEAGINPALMYGSAGSGGSTAATAAATPSGTGSADGASRTMAAGKTAMDVAQLSLLSAQKENIEADTANKKAGATDSTAGAVKKGAETEGVLLENKNKGFENEVNQLIGAEQKAKNYDWVTQRLETSATKELADWEAYNSAGFAGKATDDPSSPVAKAIKAGLDNVVTDLKNAKLEGDIKEAEGAVKAFEASLAKQGIPPNSPWGVKIIVDLLRSVGLGVGGAVESVKGAVDTVKKVIK